jgi:RNA polymerase sigma-70 factor (ECF subfamily)
MADQGSGIGDPGSGSGDRGAATTPGGESTFSLLERAHGGDGAALDRLMARHLTPLRRWARGRLPQWARDGTDTDDLVQHALLQTFKRLDQIEIRGPGALLAYLRQAVLNQVRNEMRRTGRRPGMTGFDEGEADPGQSPLEQAIGREAVGRYEQALMRLRPEEREAIVGRVELGYSYEELADALEKPSAEAARKAARRALLRLVEEMNRAGV